jgi:hypothetical protein
MLDAVLAEIATNWSNADLFRCGVNKETKCYTSGFYTCGAVWRFGTKVAMSTLERGTTH